MRRMSLIRLLTSALIAVTLLGLPVGRAMAQNGVITLDGSVDFPNKRVTDVVAYVDVANQTEYAIVGYSGSTATGISIVDVSNPSLPQVVSTLDGIPGFDVKVFGSYAYTVTGGSTGRGAVIDISDPTNPVQVGDFSSSHNLFIDDKGFMYSEFPGLKIFDLNSDPTNPIRVWTDNSFDGHDATVIGDTLYDFHGRDGTFIYDVSDRSNPIEIGFIDPPFVAYHHSGWTSEDGNFLFLNDEASVDPSPDVTIWDISDTSDPILAGSISDPIATVHNLLIVGELAFFAYYASGFRVYDISIPSAPVLVGEFDTDPLAVPGFSGAFGIDVFLPSKHVLVSGASGALGQLHVFSVDGYTESEGTDGATSPTISLNIEAFPNPSVGMSTISFTASGASQLVVHNVLGRLVHSENLTAAHGRRITQWDTSGLPAGIYFVNITSDGETGTKSISVVK